MKLVILAICLMQGVHLAVGSRVPLFVWGDVSSKATPVFSSAATENLNAILSDDTAKIVFIENQLNTDDLTVCSLNGQPCFGFLSKQTTKYYSPNIEDPVTYLRSRIWSGPVRSVNSDEEFTVAAGETVFVHFRDTGLHPTHNDRLAAHDLDIQGIVTRLGNKGITYVYTANEEVHKRVARQTEVEVPYAPILLSRGPFHIFALNTIQHAPNLVDPRTNVTVAGATVTFTNTTETAILTVNTTPNLVLNLAIAGGRWWVEQVTYDGKHFTDGSWIGANRGFSYSCSPDMVFVSPNTTEQFLFISGLQLQVELEPEAGTTELNFGPDFNCVGFTSGGIWGGLFVTLLLLLILSIGISWMLDINTMDRFDDAKGKTITINATD